jgi:Protein of unknown function (DUF4058)
MSSPFPGMDPFLEDPGLWPDAHNSLIFVIREFINQRLDPKYFVRIEDRVYISDDDDPGRAVIIPDVRIGERPPGAERSVTPPSSTAALEVDEPVVITTLFDDEIHEPFLEVIDRGNRQVVTVIEVVSPTNKVEGARGRESYRQKRVEILNSPSHWVEIDLLRSGIPWIPRQMISRGDYLVFLSRVERRPTSHLWPIRLTERLPVVAIPLKAGDPDAPLDLQSVLDTVYERSGYERVIDYRQSPPSPLSAEKDTWADQLLKSKNLR